MTVPETGLVKQLVIHDQEESTASDLADRRTALAALKFHPREDSQNAALMARAQRCYEGFLGDRRDYIGQLISHFEGVLESQDPRVIESSRSDLTKQLDEMEGDRFL